MKINILSETEHYAIIEPPGESPATASEALASFEQLRAEHGLRLCYVHKQVFGRSAVLVCEKLEPGSPKGPWASLDSAS